ncbi:hypothetical protein [Trichocoleus sp. DQ-U1]
MNDLAGVLLSFGSAIAKRRRVGSHPMIYREGIAIARANIGYI